MVEATGGRNGWLLLIFSASSAFFWYLAWTAPAQESAANVMMAAWLTVGAAQEWVGASEEAKRWLAGVPVLALLAHVAQDVMRSLEDHPASRLVLLATAAAMALIALVWKLARKPSPAGGR